MIDRKCKVTLGGLPQKIHVKGDETKPVLLFLHGGPGVCNRHTVMTVHADPVSYTHLTLPTILLV